MAAIKTGMAANEYGKLPEPFKRRKSDLGYTMQLAIVPVAVGKHHIFKHFNFSSPRVKFADSKKLMQGHMFNFSWGQNKQLTIKEF